MAEGCRNPNDEFSGNPPCTPNHVPTGAASIEYEEYPENLTRGTFYNLDDSADDAVMYDSVFVQAPTGGRNTSSSAYDAPPSSHCGKLSAVGAGSNSYSFFTGNGTYYYDYVPFKLSFHEQLSETWFSYLYDASNRGGTVGIPCYYLEQENSTITSTGASTPGNPNANPPVPDTPGESSSEQDSGTRCIPCSSVPCEPEEMVLTYGDNDQDYTGDQDCPHPTLFAIDTRSPKIVLSYNSFSTTIPNGVTDFSFSYDGTTYTDVFDAASPYGVVYDSPQNPWATLEDVGYFDFEIFEMDTLPTKSGFRIKASITPIYDENTQTFSGTRWTVLELVGPGTGYAVNDVYQISSDLILDNGTTATVTMNVKITAVAPREITEGETGFDRLRVNDTLNGHTITRTFHTDLENFTYHVMYLDGNGSVFTKDGQYTSNRNHVVTVSAGYGIVDRAQLIGLYEFRNKSLQFQTVSQDPTAPNTFSVSIQPDIVGTVVNGQVTGVTINNGGSGWDQMPNNEDPILTINPPSSPSGTTARVSGIFTDGVITGVNIIEPGSGYSSNIPPFLWVYNQFKTQTDVVDNAGYSETASAELDDYLLRQIPDVDSQIRNNMKTASSSVPKTTTVVSNPAKVDVKKDFERERSKDLIQRLNRVEDMQPLVDEYTVRYDYNHLNDIENMTPEFKKIMNDGRDADIQARKDLWLGFAQEVVPETVTYDANLVETCIGSMSNLPYASERTKYLMKQFEPDTRKRITLNVSLACNMTSTGCGIATCPSPVVSPAVNTTTSNPDGSSESISRSYLLSPLLGPGCQNWIATGVIDINNNMTGSNQRVTEATEAQGNPYDEGFAN